MLLQLCHLLLRLHHLTLQLLLYLRLLVLCACCNLQQCFYQLAVLINVVHPGVAQCSLLQVVGQPFVYVGGAILVSLHSSISGAAAAAANISKPCIGIFANEVCCISNQTMAHIYEFDTFTSYASCAERMLHHMGLTSSWPLC
jgi:hypothetical protein